MNRPCLPFAGHRTNRKAFANTSTKSSEAIANCIHFIITLNRPDISGYCLFFSALVAWMQRLQAQCLACAFLRGNLHITNGAMPVQSLSAYKNTAIMVKACQKDLEAHALPWSCPSSLQKPASNLYTGSVLWNSPV